VCGWRHITGVVGLISELLSCSRVNCLLRLSKLILVFVLISERPVHKGLWMFCPLDVSPPVVSPPPPSKFAWTQCLYCVFDIFLASTCELKCHSSSANHKLLITVPAGLRIAQPCRYCFYSLAQKWVFCPAGATRCPNKQLSRLSGQNVGIQPQKLSKF